MEAKMIWQRLLAALALTGAALTAGCLILAKLGLYEPPGAFSHKVHGKEQELECQNCHATAEKSEKAGMPKLRQCMLCHEGIDEEKSPERKLSVLYGENYQWIPPPVISEEVIFSHQLHVTGKQIACGECHRGIEENAGITNKVRVFKDDCMDCHARAGKSNECAVCHKEIRQDRGPANHLHNWRQFHGQVVRAGSEKSADRCSLCHADSSCADCHQDEPPRNHNNHWRHRGHGIAVSIDRDRCAACHRDDFCDRCHREVSPRNHVGSWGDSRNRHCLTCHFPLRDEACFVCHKLTPAGHLAAPAKPANAQHAVATEATCRTCHDVIGIPHLDNGDNCGNCHF